MLRCVKTYLLFALIASSSVGVGPFVGAIEAQEWASSMFNTLNHDFGTVARGAKAVYRFQVKNVFEEDVHIASVQSSCNCTTPQIVKPDLKTFEVGEIVAELNTIAHIGQKHATIKVTFDKPFYAEVQLNITGSIRGDVVVTPGDIRLGSVDQGKAVEKKITVAHAAQAGRNDWQIVDVMTADPHFEVDMSAPMRSSDRVDYELTVRLKNDAPPGYIKDQLILVTNDPNAPQLFIEIDGRVVSPITVSPSSLFMGVVSPGQTVKKQLLVRGKTPFKIVDVQCEDETFTVEPDTDSKDKHLVPVQFTADDQVGKVSREIKITTDVRGADDLVFTAYAQVVAAAPPKKSVKEDSK